MNPPIIGETNFAIKRRLFSLDIIDISAIKIYVGKTYSAIRRF